MYFSGLQMVTYHEVILSLFVVRFHIIFFVTNGLAMNFVKLRMLRGKLACTLISFI